MMNLQMFKLDLEKAEELEIKLSTSFGSSKKQKEFQIGKGVCQGCILSPCFFNLHAGYIMRNTGLDEPRAGIKIAGRNITNLRYADDSTLMAKELKNLLMKVKEEVKKLT